MRFNRSIELDCLAAWACWTLGAIMSIGDMFGFLPDDSGFGGIALIALGHLVTTHRTIVRMEEREGRAFDLGREAGLRSIRR